jgi:hypothetical protein
MTFAEWIAQEDAKRPTGRGTLSDLMWKTKIGLTTLHCIKAGRPASKRVAIALNKVTRGAVAVDDLMAGSPEYKKRAR